MTNDYISPGSRGTSATENSAAGITTGENITELPTVKATLPGSGGEVPCDVCRSTGLAILPVRYTVVPASCPGAGLGPFPKGKACQEDVATAGYEYAVRTLRQGMLYLFYEQSGPYGPRQWEAYAIAENGTLWRQPSAHAARRIVGGGLPACSRSSHDAMRMEFLTIQRPHLCGTVWIAFSQEVWTSGTLDRYANDAKLRAERMQPIQPASWVKSPQASNDCVPLNDVDALKYVMEYRYFPGTVGEPVELPHLRDPQGISNADGSYKAEVLGANATRYPWSLRNQAGKQEEIDAPVQQRYKLLCEYSHDGGQGEQRTKYTPMLLGLWDAVGVVHELNGYRHDVIGYMARYKEERALELNAMEHIDEISTLLRQNAAVLADRYAQNSRDRLKEIEIKMEEASRDPSNPSALSSKISMQHMRAEGLDSNNDATWDALSKSLLPLFQREAQEQWESKYWPLIDEAKYRGFKRNLQAFSEAAMALLKPRSQVLGKWLRNELFLVTLEDYDGTSPVCGVRFEDAITDAIEGLGIDEDGRELLTQLADNLDVTSRSCLLWRVVAQNQDDARTELKQALNEAESQKGSLLTGLGGTGWSTFVSGTGYLKKYLVLYQKIELVQKEATPTTAANRILRQTGVDRFVTSAGAFMLNRFPLNGVQDRVGNAIVRFVFLTRALMNSEEALDLISREASTGTAARIYFFQRVQHYSAQQLTANNPTMYALRDVERHHGRSLMEDRWRRAAENSRNTARLNSLTGVLELFNFINLLSKADKQARDYGMLMASGASLVSVYTSVAGTVNKEFFGEASRSVGRMKALGGLVGGFATFIGVYYDAGDIKQYYSKRDWGMLAILGFKAGLGTAVSGSQFLTALAYSAPVFQKVMGRNGFVVLLDGLKTGMQAAAARGTGQILATRAMARIGFWVVRLAGWEVAVAITAIQGLIWMMSPNALEKWCEKNVFGKVSEGGWLGFGASEPHYKNLNEQDEAFSSALGQVTARSSDSNGSKS